MSRPFPVYPVSADDVDRLFVVLEHAFASPAFLEVERVAERELLEVDRTLGAYDGEQVVGSATMYSLRMTVPGGHLVPTAGVSWVAVLPTHRRRGIMRDLMRRQLDDIHQGGREPIAALWASEPAIYGRFGYGMASTSLALEVPRAQHRLLGVPGAAELRVRLVDAEASLDAVRAVYDAAVPRRAGMLAPPTQAWRRARILDPESRREGASALRTLLVEDDAGEVRAYARYTTKPEWGPGGAAGVLTVRELEWRDPAGAAAAWRYLLDVDLIATVKARNRPVDEPLLQLLANPRGARPVVGDALYVRIVELADAMRARAYAGPVDVVLDVEDEFCPWNSGRWRLRVSAGEVQCARTDTPADIALTARELGATYLGGTTLRALADAGLITEHTPGRVTALSRALRDDAAPWCPFVF